MPQGKYSELSTERVMAALDGDREAFAELYRCYGPTVRSTVAAVVRHRSQLAVHFDDIVAEVWTRFVADDRKRLRSFDPSRGPFGYYLRMRTFALARMLADQILRRSKTVELDDPFHSTFCSDEFEGQMLGRSELEALDREVRERLSEADLLLFDQVLVLGRNVGQVASELGITRDAAYRRSHRLKQKVLVIAQELGIGGPTGPRPTAVLALLIAFCAQGAIETEEISGSVSEVARGDA